MRFFVICAFNIVNLVFSYRLYQSLDRNRASSRLFSSEDARSSSGAAIWNEGVQYVDLSSADVSLSPNNRNLPLFCLSGAFYPSGLTYLHVFEMKYRTMMFDVQSSDKLFGYIHTNQKTGQIASYGTLCKITETELLEDGRQFVALEGVGRFHVKKIVKTLPYIVGDVELGIEDDIPSDPQAIIKLEFEVYDALKYYIRLMKSYAPNASMTITAAAKTSRPQKANISDHFRRTKFSFAIANMIQMTHDKESQLILQTRDIGKRLEVEKLILTTAAELVAEKLIQMEMLTATQRDEIKTRTYTSDYEDDILPFEDSEATAGEEKDEWDISNVM